MLHLLLAPPPPWHFALKCQKKLMCEAIMHFNLLYYALVRKQKYCFLYTSRLAVKI